MQERIKNAIYEAVVKGLSSKPEPEGREYFRKACGISLSIMRDGDDLRLIWGLPLKGVCKFTVSGARIEEGRELLPQVAPVFRNLGKRLDMEAEDMGISLESLVGPELCELCARLSAPVPEKAPESVPSPQNVQNKKRGFNNRKGAKK